ncbi:MAG TPA: DUF1653 domain-containing protein [Burkholderiaceae bacterium]|nr:DUF1653 domain-containing protein [Burkholderiaceae bacterium]
MSDALPDSDLPALPASGWWVRPHAMFFGPVTIAGRVQPRFSRVGAA